MKIFAFVPIKLKNFKRSKYDLLYFLIHFASKHQVRLDSNQLLISHYFNMGRNLSRVHCKKNANKKTKPINFTKRQTIISTTSIRSNNKNQSTEYKFKTKKKKKKK